VDAGEQTRGQFKFIGLSLAGSAPTAKALPGTFSLYRQMRSNPSIALARAAATAPIRGANWTVASSDETRREFIEKMLVALWPQLIRNTLFAFDYGFQAFEKIWKYADGLYALAKLKPLLPDLTTVRVDDSGRFAGVKNLSVGLAPEKCFVYTYDEEAGNFYGRSRHENVKAVYGQWLEDMVKQGQYRKRVAGTIPLVEYPPGESETQSGTMDNFDVAKNVLAKLGSGDGVVMPNTLAAFAEQFMRRGGDPGGFRAWKISFLEPKIAHGDEFISGLRHKESLMFRGWLVPERAVTEGQAGTKAEAEAHGDVAITIADLEFQDIVRAINWYVVDDVLAANWGEEARGSVEIVPAGLGERERETLRALALAVFGNPQNVDLLLSHVDLRALLDGVGLPQPEGDGTEELWRGAKRAVRSLR